MFEHLDDYLDTLAGLPHELQRYSLMLQRIPEVPLPTVDDLKACLTKKEGSPERTALLSTLQEALKHAEARSSLAEATFEMVSAHARRLDDDMRWAEEEMRLAGIRIPTHNHSNTLDGTNGDGISGGMVPFSVRMSRAHENINGTGRALRHKTKSASSSSHKREEKDNTGNDERKSKKKSRHKKHKEIRQAHSAASDEDEVEEDEQEEDVQRRQPTPLLVKRKRMRDLPTPGSIYCPCGQAIDSTLVNPDVDLISCDYGRCPYEWFHRKCLTAEQLPSPSENDGDNSKVWICPECRDKVRRRHARRQINQL